MAMLGYDFKGSPIYSGDKVEVIDSDGPSGIVGLTATALSLTTGKRPRRVQISLPRRNPNKDGWWAVYPDFLVVVKKSSHQGDKA